MRVCRVAGCVAVFSHVCLGACAPPPQDRADAQAPSPPAPKPAPILPELAVDPERLMEALRALPTSRAAWADEAHANGLRQTEQLLIDRLKAMGYTPSLEPIDFLGSRTQTPQPKSGASDAPWNNIIVDLPGTTAKHEVVLIGAHFDAVPNSPGADDNGTGTACLLEAARVLKSYPMQRSVRLVFFNLEEIGLVGSRAHVERLKPRLESKEEQLVGMISLEMLGYFTDEANSQRSPLPANDIFTPPTTGNFLALVGLQRHQGFSQAFAKAMTASEPGLPVLAVDFLPIAPPDFARSDHAPFLGAGLPGVMLTDTANFRNPNYHTPKDTVDTIDQKRFVLACRAVIGATHRVAGPAREALPDLTTKQTKPGEPRKSNASP
jgi:Peptidase family M28